MEYIPTPNVWYIRCLTCGALFTDAAAAGEQHYFNGDGSNCSPEMRDWELVIFTEEDLEDGAAFNPAATEVSVRLRDEELRRRLEEE